AFKYVLPITVLPLMFIYNHQLLLIGIGGWLHLFVVLAGALIGILVFVSVTQRIFVTRTRIWEAAVLLLACFMLFRPGFFMDRVDEPYHDEPGERIVELAEAAPDG